MTNEEMLLMALNGAQLPDGMTFQPQNNKQAYLAYACGLLTDASLLPPPRTREEFLLREYCLNGGGGGSGGDAFEINDASYLFYSASRIKEMEKYIPRIKNCTSTRSMFHYGSGNLGERRTSLDLSNLDVSRTTDMSSMFEAYYRLKTLSGLSNWDTSKVTTMASMFKQCNDLESLDLSGWDVSSVTSTANMFSACSSLASLDFSGWKLSEITTMASMFNACEKLKTLNLSGWDTSKVTTMASTFNGCKNLESIDMSGWTTPAVTTFSSMFWSCSSLKSVDLSNFDTSKATNMSNMFGGCLALKEIIGFSATNKIGISIEFPKGASGSPYALRRLTFRTDLPANQYSIRSAVDISYCSFEREGMVEMFNTLPDITKITVGSSYKKITITGNPCVTGTGTIAGGTYEGTVAELADFITDNHLGETMCELNIDGQVMAVMGREIPSYFEGFAPEDIATFNYPDVTYEVETLTAEDRAIATAKGWTLVG